MIPVPSHNLIPRLALVLALCASAPLSADPLLKSDAEISNEYRERVAFVLQDAIDRIDPDNPDAGGVYDLAVAVNRGEHVEWARQRLRSYNETPAGNMFWMIPMVLIMHADNGSLNDDDWSLIQELWRTYYPYRGDTENHWLMYYVALYLAAEMFPEADTGAWFNGRSSVENMAEAKEYILDWVRITTSYGQGEYDSPRYIGEYTRPMALLAGWARDAELRKVGHMMMDYLILDFVVESVEGLHGGAQSRAYPREILRPALTVSMAHSWLFFGQGEFSPNASNTLVALSGYTPPPILFRIAHDRNEAYVHKELKRTRWRLRNVGPDTFEVEGKRSRPVYKYSYVHPDYILGSSQGGLLQPIQQRTWNLIWREDDPWDKSNSFFALHPYSSPKEGSMYFPADWDTVTDLIARSKADYDTEDKLIGGSKYEYVVQHESALIGLYDIPEGTRFPLINTFFSRDLEQVVEDPSGWIFAQGGPIYIAYFPMAPGEWKPVDWTGLMAGGAGGWFSANFVEWSEGSKSLVSYELKNGYVVQVAPVSEFDSYEEFKSTIKSLPLDYSLEPVPSVRFTTLEGIELSVEYQAPLYVDGQPVRFEDWMLFDGPFSRAERGSRTLDIIYGDELYHLDFINNRIESSIISDR